MRKREVRPPQVQTLGSKSQAGGSLDVLLAAVVPRVLPAATWVQGIGGWGQRVLRVVDSDTREVAPTPGTAKPSEGEERITPRAQNAGPIQSTVTWRLSQNIHLAETRKLQA